MLKAKIARELMADPSYLRQRQTLEQETRFTVDGLCVRLIEVFPPNRLFRRD